MKKIMTIIAVIGVMVLSQQANAQSRRESVKNRLGFFGAVASGDIETIGIGGIGEFKVAPRVTISPQFILFAPNDRGPYSVNFFEMNANANYYFYNYGVFEFYGLGGLNYTRRHRNWDDGIRDDYDANLGLNIGGGVNFELGRVFVPFSEIRATVGGFDQLVITGGLKFNLHQ